MFHSSLQSVTSFSATFDVVAFGAMDIYRKKRRSSKHDTQIGTASNKITDRMTDPESVSVKLIYKKLCVVNFPLIRTGLDYLTPFSKNVKNVQSELDCHGFVPLMIHSIAKVTFSTLARVAIGQYYYIKK